MNKDIELLREAATYLDFSTKTKGVSDCADLVAFLRSLADRMEKAEPVAWIVPDFAFLFPTKEAAERYLSNINDTRAAFPLFINPTGCEVELKSAIQKQRDRYEQQNAELQVEVERLKAENKRLAREMFVLSVYHEAQLSAIKQAVEKASCHNTVIENVGYVTKEDWQAILNTINQQEGE